MKADRVARSGREDLLTAAIRITAINGRAVRIVIGIDIRLRPDTDVQLLAFAVKQQAAGPMPQARAVYVGLQRENLFRRPHAHCLRIVLEALDGIRLTDV